MQNHYNIYFSSCTHEKKTCLAVQFVDRKVLSLMPKYYLLAGDTSQISIFSLQKIKISKQHRFILYTISYI